MNVDLVNAAFQLVGGYFTWKNAHQLWQDKKLVGAYWPTTAFFVVWGGWNLIMFHGLSFALSFWAGVVLLTGNAAWVVLALYYQHQDKKFREAFGVNND